MSESDKEVENAFAKLGASSTKTLSCLHQTLKVCSQCHFQNMLCCEVVVPKIRSTTLNWYTLCTYTQALLNQNNSINKDFGTLEKCGILVSNIQRLAMISHCYVIPWCNGVFVCPDDDFSYQENGKHFVMESSDDLDTIWQQISASYSRYYQNLERVTRFCESSGGKNCWSGHVHVGCSFWNMNVPGVPLLMCTSHTLSPILKACLCDYQFEQ